MKLLGYLFALLTPLTGMAQTFTLIEDANGRAIGTVPDVFDGSAGDWTNVLNENGIGFQLNARTGAVSINNQVHWESSNCTGEPFIVWADGLQQQIIRIDTNQKPDPLVLLAEWPRQFTNIQSNSYKPEGECRAYPGAPYFDQSTRDFTYIDPENFGFEITPSGEWGFPPPLSLKFVQAGETNNNGGGSGSSIKNQLAVNGLFFDPAKPGHGFDVNQTEFGLMIYYYGHTNNGERLWLISDLFTELVDYNSAIVLPMYESPPIS